jgi:membrane protease subunit HflC
LEKRILEWDGAKSEMATRDKRYIEIESYGRWRISDPQAFFVRIRDDRSAGSRLDDIIGSELRKAIGRNDLIEIVRVEKGRKPTVDSNPVNAATQTALPEIQKGRLTIENEITAAAAPKLREFGIELLDVRFMRVNYTQTVTNSIYQRMIAERQQIASQFRSEGEGEAAKILGQRERDLREIESGAYRKIQEIKGTAEAKATEIYAKAFNQSAEAVDFYRFNRALEALGTTVTKDTTLVLSTEGDILKFLKSPVSAMPAQGTAVPQPATGVPSTP